MVNEPTWPAANLVAVTPSDATTYSPPIRQLYVGTGGDVEVETVEFNTVTFVNVPSGSTLGPFFVRNVGSGTTASGLIGFI